jgi:hypothetical protein
VSSRKKRQLTKVEFRALGAPPGLMATALDRTAALGSSSWHRRDRRRDFIRRLTGDTKVSEGSKR